MDLWQPNKNDVKLLAEYCLDGTLERDTSSSVNYSGRWYCNDCGEYEDFDGNLIHENSCIVKVAQDVLTGIGDD